MKFASLLGLFLCTSTLAAENQTFEFNFEDWPTGTPPEQAFVIDGKFAVESLENNKTLSAQVGELVEACVLLGDASRGNSSIQTKVLATRQGRSFPRYCIGLHGQSGFRLVVAPALKQLQLTKNEEVITSVPLEWTSGAWLQLKLSATKQEDESWQIEGKLWAADAEESSATLVQHREVKMRGQGKCSLWATPFSNTPIHFDDVKIQIEK